MSNITGILFRFILLIATLSSTCGLADAAQFSIPRVRHVETKSGDSVYMGGFISCTDHIPYEGTAFVQHGKVTMKHIVVNQCGNPKEPATVYWYVSEPGFKGDDEVIFSYVSGSTLIVHVTVH